jgi:hypothetical protein
MIPSALEKKSLGLQRTTFRIWAGVVKPQPFNNSRTSSNFWVELNNLLRCLNTFVISLFVKPHLLMKKSMTAPLPGGIVDGVSVWVQKLGDFMWGNARGRSEDIVTNRYWDDRFHIS